MTTWEDNYIQFPRLLAEIRGLDIPLVEMEKLYQSMDLEAEEVEALFDRAEVEWIRIKENKEPRRFTPKKDVEILRDGV